MPRPHPLPTLKVFLEIAFAHGVKESIELDEDRCENRCLRLKDNPPVFLPKELQDGDIIQAFLLAYLCRGLNIDAKEFGFPSEFAENPLRMAWEWD